MLIFDLDVWLDHPDYSASRLDYQPWLPCFQRVYIGHAEDAQSAFAQVISAAENYPGIGPSDLNVIRAAFDSSTWKDWTTEDAIAHNPDRVHEIRQEGGEPVMFVVLDIGNAEPGEYPDFEWNELRGGSGDLPANSPSVGTSSNEA